MYLPNLLSGLSDCHCAPNLLSLLWIIFLLLPGTQSSPFLTLPRSPHALAPSPSNLLSENIRGLFHLHRRLWTSNDCTVFCTISTSQLLKHPHPATASRLFLLLYLLSAKHCSKCLMYINLFIPHHHLRIVRYYSYSHFIDAVTGHRVVTESEVSGVVESSPGRSGLCSL